MNQYPPRETRIWDADACYEIVVTAESNGVLKNAEPSFLEKEKKVRNRIGLLWLVLDFKTRIKFQIVDFLHPIDPDSEELSNYPLLDTLTIPKHKHEPISLSRPEVDFASWLRHLDYSPRWTRHYE